jgi:hypothetical protein
VAPAESNKPYFRIKFLLRCILAVRCNKAEFFGTATIAAEAMAAAKVMKPRTG